MRKKALLLLVVVGLLGAFFIFRSPPQTSLPSGATPSTQKGSASPRAPGKLPILPSGDGQTGAFVELTPGRPAFTAPWGSGKDALGRERPEEGNPLGPMSLAADKQGGIWVLDGVNGRVVRRNAEGRVESVTKVDYAEPQDIAVGEDGSLAVLDRYTEKSVAVYDPSGNLAGELPLEGEFISDVGEVTGVFVDGKDVFVEREHGQLVRIGDVHGQVADPPVEVPGRPSRDGQLWLHAGITEAQVGRLYVSAIVRATDKHRFTRELRLNTFVRGIVLLDSDKLGTIYFAAEVEPSGSEPVIVLSCLEPLKGVPVGGAILPVNTLPEESFRDFTVLDDGGVIHALRTEQGVTYTRYDCE